mgnify:CR=1 FL=1
MVFLVTLFAVFERDPSGRQDLASLRVLPRFAQRFLLLASCAEEYVFRPHERWPPLGL